MKDWIQKLDDFLKLSGKELLTHAGRISAEIAKHSDFIATFALSVTVFLVFGFATLR